MNKDKFLVKDGNRAEWGVPEGYPYKEQKLVTEFLPETKLTFYTPEGAPENMFIADAVIIPDFGIEKEKAYNLRIMWDGVPYDRTVLVIGNYSYFVGNQSLSGEGADTGEPFFIMMGRVTGGDATYEVNFSFMGASAGEHTLSICELSETIHPMAPDFLPQANQTTYGAIKKAAHVPNAAGDTPTAAEFNALLKSLRDAGILATE